MNKKIFKSIQLVVVSCFIMLGTTTLVEASYQGDVAGWIPWWTEDDGVRKVAKQVDELDVIYPFVYEVEEGGKIVAKADLKKGVWKDLIKKAKKNKVEVIPTIAWFNGEGIHAVLSDEVQRQRLVKDIGELVTDNNYAGIDIDFEEKWSETKDYFSEFLKELDDELGRASLACTIEARMRPEHRWLEIPAEIKYANDYEAINRHCDIIEIMAYDQQRADIVFNKKRQGVPYSPVADIDWVEHVLEFALEGIDKDKIMLGIPTYGRAYDVTVAADWYRDYKRVASLNYSRIPELAEKYDLKIGRSQGGEAVITYFPEDSVWKIFNQLPTPEGTPKGYEAAAKALLVATYAGVEIPVRYVEVSDSKAAKDKVDLAKKYGLKGVAFFKLDGSEDKNIWKLF